MAKAVGDIKKAFPDLDNGFYEKFLEIVKEEKFVDDRLMDAVNHVIKTCVYPRPTIAQFMKFNQVVNIFTYDQMLDKVNRDIKAFKKHSPVQIPGHGELMWVSNKDIELHNLK